MKYGDRVYLLAEDGSDFIIELKEGEKFVTHLGSVEHSEIVKADLGDVVETNLKKKIYVLKPGIVENIFKMKRKTQIVYPKDIGFILLMLDVKEGDRIVEAGVGSGAMCSAFARLVGDGGKVFAYERREDFLKLARENLKRWKLLERVELKLKDISEGFDEEEIDAVFLDVPDPWNYIESAWKALKGGGRLGVICPTTNQVQETLRAIESFPFVRVEVWESLFRRYKPNPERLRPFDRMVAHTTYMIFAVKVNSKNDEDKGED